MPQAESKLRFSIASPALNAATLQPQLGVDWGKYIDLYRWKEAQVAGRGETLTETLYPNAQMTTTLTTTVP